MSHASFRARPMRRPRALLALAFPAVLLACETPEPAPPAVPDPALVRITPPDLKVRRLNQDQYRNAVRDVIGPEVEIARAFEPDVAVDGLVALGSGETTISPWGTEQYEKLAFDIARQITTKPELRARHLGCTPEVVADTNCAAAILEPLATRLWRRPLAAAELIHPETGMDGLADLAAQAASALGNFEAGLEFGIAAVLQSPHFLYLAEAGETDPADSRRLRYNDYELAARLAFFLWNTIPDEALLAAAERGELTELETLRPVVDSMLADERARAGIRAFFNDMLMLRELTHLNKDPLEFPHFDSQLGPSAREETLRLIEFFVIDRDADYRTLFTTRMTFVNPQLAALYEVRTDTLNDFAMIEHPRQTMRTGLLGHASILAAHSHPRSTSATLRGRFIRETLLCGEIPPPAADVNTAIPEPTPDAPTLRDRVAVHLEDDFCGSCHANMDPIGLGLENFDSIGRFRLQERGAPIDAAGTLDGDHFATPDELARVVADHPELPSCLVRNAVRYATGQYEQPAQFAATRALTEAFTAQGYRVRQLMRDVALSPVFRFAAPPAETAAAPASTGGTP